jgi:hypothetical protein
VGYVRDLHIAAQAGLLTGRYLGIAPYNWNRTPFRAGSGIDWPGKYRSIMPGFPVVDLVADYVGQGVVIYWLEPNALAAALTLPLIVPNERLVRPRN